jgi:hypothetical protein
MSYMAGSGVTKWDSKGDLKKMTAHFRERNPDAPAETADWRYWQSKANISKLDNESDFRRIDGLMSQYQKPAPAPAPAPAPTSTGGSAAAQAAANTAATAERDYRASIPKVEMGSIKPGTSWDTLENGRYIAAHEGGSKDNDRNRPIDTSNANFATKAMVNYGAGIQRNYGDFIDSLRADAMNNSAQMLDIDKRNRETLRPDLALKNPAEELRKFYEEISGKIGQYV